MADPLKLRHEAQGWILRRLAAGPVASLVLVADGLAAGFNRSRLDRARRAMPGLVRVRKLGGAGVGWQWELVPAVESPPA